MVGLFWTLSFIYIFMIENELRITTENEKKREFCAKFDSVLPSSPRIEE